MTSTEKENYQATSSQPKNNRKSRGRKNESSAHKHYLDIKLQGELRAKHGCVKNFSIDDPEYPPQTVYCIPFEGDSSDELIREMIGMILEDGAPLAGTTTRIIGFDVEWCHDFKEKKERPISLIQICGTRISLIIQLAHLQAPIWKQKVLPTPVGEFLRDRSIIKLGVGITGDTQKFARDRFSDQENHKVYLDAYLEIHDLAKLVDPTAKDQLSHHSVSLQRFVARYLHQYLHKSKNLTLSNWESSQLNRAQITC